MTKDDVGGGRGVKNSGFEDDVISGWPLSK